MDQVVDKPAVRPARPEEWLGRELRAAREAGRLSLRELARRLHRSHSNLWDYERGHRFAPVEIVREYADELGIAPDPLLELWERARVDLFGEDRTRRRPFVGTAGVIDLRTGDAGSASAPGTETAPGEADNGVGLAGAGSTLCLFGGVEATGPAGPVDLGGPRSRELLGVLLLHANRRVAVDDVADMLAIGGRAAARVHAVERITERLGAALGVFDPHDVRLVVDPSGCTLTTDVDRIDAERFRREAEHGVQLCSDARWATAAEALTGALSLWKGTPFGDLARRDWARDEVGRLEEVRLGAMVALGRAWLELGHHDRVVADHQRLVAAHPLHEEIRAQLMLALYRSRRRAEALRTYEDLQDQLARDVGVAPGRDIAALADGIRRQDPALDWPAGAGGEAPEPYPATARRSARGHGGGEPAFVGRAEAVLRFEGWLADAAGGDRRVVVVTGEAGIGKSRLVSEVLAGAGAAGFAVLAGACHEHASVPYLPIASALTTVLGGDASPFLAGFDSRPPDPEQLAAVSDRQRLALFLAAATALDEQLERQPTALVVEDVHWADEPTLALLEHLVSHVGQRSMFRPAPLLVVLTARPSPLPGPEASLLERLATDAAWRRLTLEGLDELETNDLVTSLAGRPPSRRLLRLLHEAGAGNPLATRLLVQGLLDEGRVARRGRELVLVGAWHPGNAPGVDAEVRAALGRVAPATRALVTQAAVLGAEGDVDELAAVAGLAPDALDLLLDDAAAHGLLADDGSRYRFTHPQIPRLLYRELRTRRRRELHRLVADRLERGTTVRDGRWTLRVAHHVREAGDLVPPERVVRFAVAAGEQAFALAAWSDAAVHYETALDRLGEAGGVDGDFPPVAELHHRAGVAHFRNHDVAAASAHLEESVRLAKAAGDLRQWGSSALVLLRARMAYGSGLGGDAPDPRPASEFIEAAGDREPRLRARALAQLAELHFERFDFEGGMALGLEARALARDIDDHQLACEIEFSIGLQHLGRLVLDAARDSFRASRDHARHLEDGWQEAWGLGRLPLIGWIAGDLDDADRLGREAEELAARHHDWAEHSLATACRTGAAVARGDYTTADELGVVARKMLLRSDYHATPMLLFPALACSHAVRGDREAALAVIEEWQRQGGRSLRPCRLLVEAVAGDHGELRRDLEARPWRMGDASQIDLFSSFGPLAEVELAAATGDVALAAHAYDHLRELHRRGVAWYPGWSLFVPRLLGVAARMLGRPAEAASWFADALALAGRAGSRAETARTRFSLAQLLGDTRDPAELRRAREHVAAAAAAFDELGMMPFLAASHSLAAVLAGRSDRVLDTGAVRAVLFTDIVGSTELNVRAGDARWVELLRDHDRIVRARLREFDGVEFKHTGDGISAWFPSAAAAVLCALRITEDLERANLDHPDLPVSVRCGIASGTPIDEGTDLFGLAVVTASRICALASAGKVLVSQDAVELAVGADPSLHFDRLGRFTLKGLPEPSTVHTARTVEAVTV